MPELLTIHLGRMRGEVCKLPTYNSEGLWLRYLVNFIHHLSVSRSFCCFMVSLKHRNHLPCCLWSGQAGYIKQTCLSSIRKYFIWKISRKEKVHTSFQPPRSVDFYFFSKFCRLTLYLTILTVAGISFLLPLPEYFSNSPKSLES